MFDASQHAVHIGHTGDPHEAGAARAPRRAPARAGQECDGTVKSATRVLELFAFFAEQRRPLTVSDIVRGLDYPQSSASALLKSLAKSGYLDYDRHRRHYLPTLRVALLGGWVHDQLFSPTSLSRMVDDLHAATGQTVVIGMQNEIHVQYIHIVQKLPDPCYLKPGSLRPLARAGVGKVLLARKPDADVLHLLRRINAEEIDPSNRVDPADLLAELEQVRRCGHALSHGNVNPERGVVAVELPTPASQPPMAIGLSVHVDQVEQQRVRYLELLNQALRPYRGSL
jgi:DNA-binding IclR family transcriptional regulator